MNTPPELARLAESTRRLIDVIVKIVSHPEPLGGAADRIDALVNELQPMVPSPPPPRYPGIPSSGEPADFFPYDCVVGKLNPLAAPVQIEWKDPKAIGRVCFGTPYEGPPGCVHGAVIAAVFDQMLNVANLMSGTPGPTARLELRFHRPTPLFKEVRFEAWRERIEEKKVHSAGRLLVDGNVTVEASGTFVLLSPDRVMKLLEGA